VHRLPRGVRWYHPGVWWRRHADAIDVVHAHALHRLSGQVVARAAAAGVPSLVKVASADDVQMHADPAGWNAEHASAGRRLGLLRRGALRTAFRRLLHADRFVALNGGIARALVDAGVPPGRVVQLPNGVDVLRLRPAQAEERARARLRLGVAPEACCVVFVGRLVASKDVASLLSAVRRLPPGPAVDVLVVGDGPERLRLEEAARTLGEGRRARLLGERSDVPSILQAADVFASPSRTEGMPNAVLEALASGVASALSDIPGHGDTAAGREHALFFPAGDADALAHALQRLRIDTGLRRTLAARARAAACEAFSLAVLARRYADLYREIGAGAA
jgi:glycosyltransferase involved in cell wall biosynthesis